MSAKPSAMSPTRRFSIAVLVVAIAIAAHASAASASTFSPVIPPSTWTWGDCNISAGPVFDGFTSNWGVIGGVQVVCRSTHSFISTTVSEQWSSNGATFANYGSNGSAYFPKTSGFRSDYIVQTGRLCGSGYWRTAATVQIGGLGTWTFWSAPKNTTTGCHV